LIRAGESDNDAVSETFSNVTNFILLLLALFVAISLGTVRWWLPLLFPGFTPATTQLALRLTYLTFPSVVFLALSGLLAAVLNRYNRFTLPAFAPALSSVFVIAAALLSGGERAIYIVGFATAAGAIAQFLLLVPAAARLGIRYRPILNVR